MIVLGTISRPSMASTKALPLSTARLAVAPAREMASDGRRRRALLAHPGDHEQAVIDPEGQAHGREHVDDEHREREPLGDQAR